MAHRPAYRRLAGLPALAAFAATIAVAQPVRAQSDFYAHKQISVIISHAAGSPYDSFARLVIRHYGKHIAGNPTLVPQNMPGAVGMIALNTLYNRAPRDGTTIAQAGKSVVLEPLFGNELARFDPLKLNWIGSGQADVSLCFSRLDSPIKTIEDARRQQVLVGATGPTGDSSFISHLVNQLLGTKLKPVLGYPDTPNVALAMERGELDGGCGYTSTTLRAARPQWFEGKAINIFLQASLKRTSSFPDIPALGELVTDKKDREALEVAISTDPLVRTFVAPPGVPAERVEMLRSAFMATMRDPDFVAEATKSQFDVTATSGADVKALVEKLYASPQDAVQRIIEIRKIASGTAPAPTR
ncbi:MAG: hypothetical protein BGP04_05765 [Rhizobiales bacterium 62-17]|nr:hypothetical protein [Hyphomicrobiales bacterium]OJY01737.1 MAG: hypothetical protein BGP04_05765 [Rhizobiales bacterium 62-17]